MAGLLRRLPALAALADTRSRDATSATGIPCPNSPAASLRTASRLLDKAASKGVIHKNQAANRKSAMASRATAK